MTPPSTLTLIDAKILKKSGDWIKKFVTDDFVHLQSLYAPPRGSSANNLNDIVTYLYGRLNIIDNKSMALLQVSALIAAIAALGMDPMKISREMPWMCFLFRGLGIVSIVFSIAGALVALRGARIKYQHIGVAEPNTAVSAFISEGLPGKEDVRKNLQLDGPQMDYLAIISTVTAIRLINVRFARRCSIVAVISLALGLGVGLAVSGSDCSPKVEDKSQTVSCPILVDPASRETRELSYPFSLKVDLPVGKGGK